MKPYEKIKHFIDERGISQTSISRRTGIELPKLNLALNGNRRITLEEYELICGVLEVSTATFLTPRIPDEKGE